jgi:DNA-binding transcriptional LysR family regulator
MRTSPDIEIRQLRALLAVVEHGSLSRAAAALKLAQSTMSETIASLDRAIGTPVLVRRRGGHRLQLTAAGSALIPHARNVVRELHGAMQSVSSVAPQARARVDVMTVESLSTYLLPGILAAARKRWPNTRFGVMVAPCTTIRTAARDGECDLGLLLEELPLDASSRSVVEGSGFVEVVGEVPLVVFCGPSHPLLNRAGRSPLRLDTLTPFTVFVSDGAGAYYDMLLRYVTTGRLPGPRMEAAGSVEATRNAVLSDHASLGILPVYAVAAQLRSGQAKSLCIEPPPPRMRIAAYLPVSGGHPAAGTLVECARQAVRPPGPTVLPASA